MGFFVFGYVRTSHTARPPNNRERATRRLEYAAVWTPILVSTGGVNSTASPMCVRQTRGKVTQKAVLVCKTSIESSASGDRRDIGDRK